MSTDAVPAGPRTIIVTGATGRQGGGLVHALSRANAAAVAAGGAAPWRIVGVSRAPAADTMAAAAAAGAELQQADAMDRASLDALLARNAPVYGFFAVTNPFSVRWSGGRPPKTDVAAEVKQGINMVDAAAAAGVAFFVLTSAAGARDTDCDVPTMVVKVKIEQHLAAAPARMQWAVLAPGGFFENMTSPFAGLKQGVVPGLLKPGVQMQMVAAADVGALAAAVFAAGPAAWHGRRLEVAGDTLTAADMAATLSALRGGEPWRVSTPPAWVFFLFIPAAVSTLKRFLEHKTSRVDVAACRAVLPELRDFRQWAVSMGYQTHVFAAPSACAVA